MPQIYADDAYLLSLYPQFFILQRAQWRVTVLSAVQGTEYAIEASTDPTPYAVTVQAGETLGSLQGKLKTAINGSSLVLTAANNLAAELLVSEVKAGTVALSVSPEGGLLVELVAAADKYASLRAAWLEATRPEIGLCVWGAKAAAGHASLAAHYITNAIATDPNSGLSAAQISAMRLGPASVSFGGAQQGGQSSDPLASTGYGRAYLAMRSSLVLTPIADVGGFACC